MEGEHDSEPLVTGATAGVDGASIGAITPPPAPIPLPDAPPEYAPYSPPPLTAPMLMPSAFVPPPAKGRKGSRRWLVVTLIVLLVIAGAGGAGAYVANTSLSAQYSPQKAVIDYFAAQAHGNVAGMISNATYIRGDGAYSEFFDQTEITAMLTISQNVAISNVKVVTIRKVDDSTSNVTVSMTWADNQRTHTYAVKRDDSRIHDLLYYSWRIQIPAATINITLPNQPGALELDNIPFPAGAIQTAITTIEGYHKITMQSTDFYEPADEMVDAVDANPTATFESKLSSLATDAAKASINAAFNSCNANVYYDCLNHTYLAPHTANTIYYLTMPGYAEIDYTRYVFALRSDPTADIKLVVATDPGKLDASGSCAVVMTVDGSRKYNFHGTWTAVLTVSAGGYSSDVTSACASAKG